VATKKSGERFAAEFLGREVGNFAATLAGIEAHSSQLTSQLFTFYSSRASSNFRAKLFWTNADTDIALLCYEIFSFLFLVKE